MSIPSGFHSSRHLKMNGVRVSSRFDHRTDFIICIMTAFNRAIWHSWILEGYTFILYQHLDEDTVLLKPVKEDHGEHGLHESVTCIPIPADEI